MLSFMPDLATILAFALASVVLIVTPGPDMALQLSRTVNYGRAHGLSTALGSNVGILIHSALVALGISVLIVAAPVAFLALKIGGAIYLLWLALQAVLYGRGLRIAEADARPPRPVQSFAAGMAINLLNPKVVLFFITFLPQFVAHDDPAVVQKLFFLGGEFALIYLPCCLLLVLAADRIAFVLRTSRWLARALNYGFAAVFAGFATLILTAQARHA
jgi:threonine/homoserine/homoserine lactone efflux protein